jgi:hypothetical protein
MHVSWWMHCLDVIEMGALACVLILILWKRLFSRWPALLFALAFELATDLRLHYLLLHPVGTYKKYFYTYWIAMGIQAFLRLFIIADIIRSFPGLDFVPKRIYWFFGVIALTLSGCAGLYFFRSSHHGAMQIKDCAVLLDQSIWVAWGAFFVAYLTLFKVLNFGWSGLGASITAGFGVRVCIGMTIAGLRTNESIKLRATANILESLATIVVFISWVCSFSRSLKKHEPLPDSPYSQRMLAIFLAIASSRER